MSNETKATFAEWLSSHPYSGHISEFIAWVLQYEEVETGKVPSKKRKLQLEEAILYLDDLSMHLETEDILKLSIFKPFQFFNPDKLMRTAKKNGFIALTLTDVPLEERPELEEQLWYTMRLYSIFLDFYKLSEEEAAAFQPMLEELELPVSVRRSQLFGWILFTVLLFLLSAGATATLILSGKLLAGVIAGGVLFLGFVLWLIFGLRQTLPFQFKRMKKNAELYCLRGQICDVGEARPFSSVNYKTQAFHVSSLHDSLGKSFTFFAINPVACETDGQLYQIIYIKDMNLVLETLPL